MPADPRTKIILATGAKLYPTINYELMSEGYGEEYQDGSPVVTMRARTRWGRSLEFIANMTGVAATNLDRDSGVSRFIPAMHPDADYQPTDVAIGNLHAPFMGFWCTGAKLVGTHGELTCQYPATGALAPAIRKPDEMEEGVDYDAITGELLDPGFDDNKPILTGVGMAEYELQFSPLLYEVRSDEEMDALEEPLRSCELSRYCVRRERFQGNNFTLNPGSLYWRDRLLVNVNDPQAQIDSSAVRPFPNSNYQITVHKFPGIPREAIARCIGKVNKAEVGPAAPDGKFDYRPDWQGLVWAGGVIDGFLPGQLMYEGVSDIVPEITACGQLLYSLTHNFFWREDGHNKIYRSSTDTFERVVRASTKAGPAAGYKDFLDEATFTDLFRL